MRKIYSFLVLLLTAGTLSAQLPTVSGTTKFKAINSNNSWYATVADIATAIGAALPADEIAVGTGSGLTSYAGFTFDGVSMHIEGDIDIVTNNAALVINDNAASSAAQGGTVYATSTDGTALGDGHRLGGLIFLGSTGVSGTAQGGYLDAYADGAWSGTDSPAMLEMATTPDASMVPVPRLRVRETGNVDFLNGAEWRFYDSDNTNYTGFKAAGTISADRMLTLPTDTPSDGEQLTWHTGNTLSWDAAGSGSGSSGPDSTFSKTSGVYTGKRIGDNVYKHGTLAVRSTDTTGIMNIYSNSTTKPGLYLRYNDASSNGFNFLKLDPDAQTDNTSVGSFYGWATNFVGANVPYSSRANHVWLLGYNTAQSGGRVISTDADLHMAFESNFTNIFESGRTKRAWEWHIESQDTVGGIHRLISGRGSHDGVDGDISFASDNLTFQPYNSSTPFLTIDRNVQNMNWSDTMQTFYEKPMVGIPFFRMRDAANTRYWKMFEPDASDRLVINSEGNGLVIGASTTQFPTSGLLYTSDATALRIGATGNRSGLDIFSNTDEALRLRGPNETTGWNLRPEASEFVLQSPGAVGIMYVHESAPATSIYVEGTTGDVGFRITNPTARIHSYTANGATQAMFRQENSTGSNALYRSNATPEGAITANQGDLAQTSISSFGELYLKETGTGNTGWKPVLTAYKVTKAIPTTTNATQEVGVITHSAGARSAFVQIDAVVAAAGFAMQKRYIIPLGFSSTGGSWNILVPSEASENASWAGTNNFNLEMKTNTTGSPSGGIDTLRITRVAGSTAANCVLTIQILSGDANTTFTATSATGTSSTTTLYNQQAIAEINNKVGIGNIAPARTLHVTGEARITDLTTDPPTEIVGADADGDLGIVSRSAELTIASGTLKLAQQSATTGQVLEWNGSAWAPGTDDTGSGGSSYYQTVRDDGTGMTQRAALNFVSSSTVSAAATDDSGNNETEISLTIPTGGVTATEIATDAVGSGEIAASAVTYAKIQNVAANRLLGNPTGSAAAPSEISLGTGLGWTGTSIENTGDTDASDDAPANAAYVVTSLSAGLSAERAIAGGANVSTTDGGANSNLTIAALSGATSPSQITSDQDNYSPTSWSSSTTVRISGDATIRAITGFSALSDNTVRRLINVGSYYIYIPTEHDDSDAANRVAGNGEYILEPGGCLEMFYDGTSSRWRVTNSTFNPANMLATGRPGHYYNVAVGATTGADWGTVGFGGTNGTDVGSSTLPGGWNLNTSTSATGVATLYFSKTVIHPTAMGAAHIVSSCAVSIPTLSDGTNTYIFQLAITGNASNTTTATVNNSCGIRYTHSVNSGKWQGYSRNNAGTESTVDLGITVATGTPYVLTVCQDKALSETRFYINGAFAGRVTTNQPQSAISVGSRIIMLKSAGTTLRSVTVPHFVFYTLY